MKRESRDRERVGEEEQGDIECDKEIYAYVQIEWEVEIQANTNTYVENYIEEVEGYCEEFRKFEWIIIIIKNSRIEKQIHQSHMKNAIQSRTQWWKNNEC